MTLTLLAVSLNERPLSQPITAHFDSRGGTIGRADHNTMALPDPERHVSRLQAEIVASGSAFLIRNVGAANPIVVAGRPVACGETANLAHGDEVRIGGYLLQADMQMQEAALDVTRGRAMLSASIAPPAALPPAEAEVAPFQPPVSPAPAVFRESLPRTGAGSGNNPFADLLGGAATAPASDPFADMFGSPSAARPASVTAPRPPTSVPPSPIAAPPAPIPPTPAGKLPDDPFADLMPPPAGVLHSSAALTPAASAAAARLPDDFDPFAPVATPSRREESAPATDPFADLMPVAAPSSIDAMFGLDPAAPDPLANFMATPGPVSRGATPPQAGLSADPLQALFGEPPVQPLHRDPVQDDHLPALNAAYQPPRVVAAMQAPPAAAQPPAPPPPPPLAPRTPPPAPATDLPLTFGGALAPQQPAATHAAPAVPARPAAPAGTAAVDETDAQRLWAALCQGAEIQMPLPPGAAEERMRELGRILRSAVDGTLRLMAVRASTKHELRADVTVIQARGNNPLKFSPDAKSGLEYLLQPAMRGFLDGSAAMDDAMQDLVGHSIGTVAGMRAAIGGMLDRFGPEQLEAKLSGKSVLDSVLPINRKAKLWDLYLQHHDAIREEAQEDFHNLFGKAFLAAYEQQVAQLRRNSKGS
jgi:FHA domain-containing protein